MNEALENLVIKIIEEAQNEARLSHRVTSSSALVALRVRHAIKMAAHHCTDEYSTSCLDEALKHLSYLEDALVGDADAAESRHWSTRKMADQVKVVFQQELEVKREAEKHQLNDPAVREAVWNLTNGKCAYCDGALKPFRRDGESDGFCIEHVVPKSAGGPDNIANYVPACLGCNSSKGAEHVLLFIQRKVVNRMKQAELRLVRTPEGCR